MTNRARLAELAGKATPGPWEWDGDRMVSPGFTRRGDGKPRRAKPRDRRVISIEPDGACGDPECCPQTEHLEIGPDDRAFIAACRDAVPALLADLDRKDAALKLAREALGRQIGAIEACAVADRGGPGVNWDAVDETQDAGRRALAAVEGALTEGKT